MKTGIMNDRVNKSGVWSNEEVRFIEEHHQILTPEEIARKLKRNPRTVRKYIERKFGMTFLSIKSTEYDITTSPVWADLRKQFSSDELKIFLHHWHRIINQFKDDVYPTEQMQVVDTIKLEILMNRSLTEQQKCVSDIKRNESRLFQERSKEDKDEILIRGIEMQIASLRAAQESLHSDYRDMLQRKSSILKEMKATRDARIKNIESFKHSFSGWMVRILDSPQLRRQLGSYIEKMRIASDLEKERLSELHQYADGMLDQPILNADDVVI